MKVSSLVLGLLAGIAASAPALELQERSGPGSSTCIAPIKRKEFRKMNLVEKASFFFSVRCLMTLPSKLKSQFPISKSRYDDFILTHQANTPYIHWNGAFLPWHRAFGHAFETALREECFYPFGLPYWETALDYANLTLSPVLQRKPLSFGGDGIGPITESPPGSGIGNCVVDGAFAGLRVTMVNGPGPAVAGDHCLKRFFDQETATYWLSPQKVDLILAENSYSKMAVTLEGDINPFDPMPLLGLHSAGHTSVGGDLGDMFTSPADPLFWLHHANLDRIWAKWQAANPTARQYDIGNPIAPRSVFFNLWPDAPAGNVTFDWQLSGLGVATGQVMNTKGKGIPPAIGKPAGVLCYQYE